MTRKSAHFQKKEPLLESVLRKLRFQKIINHIPEHSKVLDIGCGYQGALLNKISPIIDKGVGFDVSVRKNAIAKNITLKKQAADSKYPLKKSSFDIVICLAVIEHVDKPDILSREIFRILKPNGQLLLTTPNVLSKPLLDFLAKIALISKEEIADHQRYYDQFSLKKELVKAGFSPNKITIEKFELGLNLFAKALK